MTVAAAEDHMDIRSMLEGLSALIDRQVVPLESEHQDVLEDQRRLYGADGGYSQETLELLRTVRMASAEAGYYGAFAPKNVGGEDLGPLASYLTWEHLHHRYGPGRLLPMQTIAHWTNGPSFLLSELDNRISDSITPAIVSGEKTVCFAMSEPDAGSDAWAMGTRATREGTSWVINGTKQWISNSPYADYAFVFAVTDDALRREKRGGISCFLVPVATPGFHIDSIIKLFGDVGGNESIISLTDVRVPLDHLVGTLDQGFALALQGVSEGRMYNAGRCVGLARWALERAVEYSATRRTFGQPISSYQGVSFMLADSAIEIYASKQMAEDCARRLERGETAVKEMAIVKAFCTEMCFQVYDRCMQVHGGMGLTNEMKLYDGWHQARTVRIADGSGEIMRRTIAARLMKGDLSF